MRTLTTLSTAILLGFFVAKDSLSFDVRSNNGNVVMTHPDTPINVMEEWIRKNVSTEDIHKETFSIRKLIVDRRPIRLRLIQGTRSNLCAIFVNKDENGQVTGFPAGFSDRKAIDFIIDHESYHCDDFSTLETMKTIQASDDKEIAKSQTERFVRDMEIRADVFAAIKHFAEGGDEEIVRRFINIRRRAWSTGDYIHDSSKELEKVIGDKNHFLGTSKTHWLSETRRLVKMPTEGEWTDYRNSSIKYASDFCKKNACAFSARTESLSTPSVMPHSRTEIKNAWLSLTGREILP